MNKRLLSILTILSVIVVLLLYFHCNKRKESTNNAINELKKEQLISFIERKTSRKIQEPATLYELNKEGNSNSNYMVLFINSSCSFCIGQLLSKMALLEDVFYNENLLIATNDTMSLSFYFNETIVDNIKMIPISNKDNDSISNYNGCLFKIKDNKTIDMMDINKLLY